MFKRLRDLFRRRQPVKPRSRLVLPPETIHDIFAIGDVHGRYDLMIDAESRILAMPGRVSGRRLVIYLGDYVDRGPDSQKVLQHLQTPLPAPFQRICICGNHDDAFLQFVRRPTFDRAWLDFGGNTTLRSYGIDSDYLLKTSPNGAELKAIAVRDVPATHLAFLEQAPVSVLVGDHLFVHAGVVPGVPLDDQDDLDLMWIREPFLSDGPRLNLTVVHGHTPSTDVTFGNRRIGIDTGAYMTNKLSILHIRDGLASVMDQ